MSDESLLRHKTYTIRLMSYRRKIGWIPKATVKHPEGDGKGHTIAGNPKDLLPTQDAADAIAKTLAMEWIDAQLPRSPIDCGDDRLNRIHTERMREWTRLRLKPN